MNAVVLCVAHCVGLAVLAMSKADHVRENRAEAGSASKTDHTLRWLVTPPAAGPWNMAVDEVLLQAAARGAGAALRFYSWQRATISLGYFQRSSDVPMEVASLPWVRRLSGGGAILHEFEITYSLVLPAGVPLLRQQADVEKDAPDLYVRVHRGIAAGLLALGIETDASHPACEPLEPGPFQNNLRTLPAQSASDGPDRSNHTETKSFTIPCATKSSDDTGREPFWCFLRRSCADLTCRGRKILGSAQRRRRGAVLQHGSLVLAPSPHLPSVTGLALPAADAAILSQWVPTLAQHVAQHLGMDLVPTDLSPSQQHAADELAHSRYACPPWLHRRP